MLLEPLGGAQTDYISAHHSQVVLVLPRVAYHLQHHPHGAKPQRVAAQLSLGALALLVVVEAVLPGGPLMKLVDWILALVPPAGLALLALLVY